MSSRQIPPGSPLDGGYREETVPLADHPQVVPPVNPMLNQPPPQQAPRPSTSVAQIAQQMVTPETKESFKTSEFMVLVLGIVGVLLASEISAEFDAPRAWMAITILGIGYLLSRGFAKAGTGRDSTPASYGSGLSGLGSQTPATPAAGVTGSAPRAAALAQQLSTPETKEFFKSTEFMVWVLGVIGILLASQANAEFDATGAWRLISYLSAGYIVSRGLAKAATERGYSDPNYGLSTDLATGSGTARAAEADQFTRRNISTPETKEFFKTSEFIVLVLTGLGLAIASNVDLFFDAPSAWTYLTIVSAAYMISRGLAKLGTRDPHMNDSGGRRTVR